MACCFFCFLSIFLIFRSPFHSPTDWLLLLLLIRWLLSGPAIVRARLPHVRFISHVSHVCHVCHVCHEIVCPFQGADVVGYYWIAVIKARNLISAMKTVRLILCIRISSHFLVESVSSVRWESGVCAHILDKHMLIDKLFSPFFGFSESFHVSPVSGFRLGSSSFSSFGTSKPLRPQPWSLKLFHGTVTERVSECTS